MCSRLALALFFLSSLASAQLTSESFSIDAFAGGDAVADGGPATEGRLYAIVGVSVAADGSVYVGDEGAGRIRRVAPGGTISTVVGSSEPVPGSDVAAERMLFSLNSVAVAPSGEVFYAGRSTSRPLEKITLEGLVETVFTNEDTSNPVVSTGVAALRFGPDGLLYFVDRTKHQVARLMGDGTVEVLAGTGDAGFSGDGGQATAAELNRPEDLAFASNGDLLIVDSRNYRVRRVDAAGVITTIAGDGDSRTGDVGGAATETSIGTPSAVLGEEDGDVLLATSNVVWRVRAADGVLESVAGRLSGGFAGDGGPATDALMIGANSLASLPNGDLLIADRGNRRVRRVDGAGLISTFAGSESFAGDGGPATEARLLQPTDAAGDRAGNVYIADAGNFVLRKVSPDGVISTVAGRPGVNAVANTAGNGGPAADALLGTVDVLAMDATGNLYLGDRGLGQVRRIDAAGVIDVVAGADERFSFIRGLAVSADGRIFVADSSANRIYVVQPDGTRAVFAGTGERGFSGDGGPAVDAQLSSPSSLKVGPDGHIYFSDLSNSRLRAVAPDGTIRTVIEFTGTLGGFVILPGGGFLISNSNNNRFNWYDAEGVRQPVFMGAGFGGDGGPLWDARVLSPGHWTALPDGRLLFADGGNHKIRAVSLAHALAEGGVLNAADFRATVAPGGIGSAFGSLLTGQVIVNTQSVLPLELGGVSLELTDSAGATHDAPLFFVAPGQINFLVPDGVAVGAGTLTAVRPAGESSVGVTVETLSPALFTGDSSGTGVAAALVKYLLADGSQPFQVTFGRNEAGAIVAESFDLGGPDDVVTLELYGTGIRGRSALDAVTATVGGVDVAVLYAGEAPGFFGLDQVNLGPLPRELAGAGAVTVVLTVDGLPSNTVTLEID